MSNQPSLFEPREDNPFAEKAKPPKKRKNVGLLALDLATVTGYCYSDGSGIWDLTTVVKTETQKRLGKKTTGKKLIKFERQISQFIDETKPKIIVIEKPFVYHSKKRRPNFTAFELAGILKLICEEKNILLFEYHAQHIKKFGTGNGQSKKEQMVLACKRYGVTPIDDNEADALHLYHLAIEDLKLK